MGTESHNKAGGGKAVGDRGTWRERDREVAERMNERGWTDRVESGQRKTNTETQLGGERERGNSQREE